jgi:hypothetical protein
MRFFMPLQALIHHPPAGLGAHIRLKRQVADHGLGQQARPDSHHPWQAVALAVKRRGAHRAEHPPLAR